MTPVNYDTNAVQSYLTILQGVINRMATNSANCKTWCITLVSAITVVTADNTKPDYIFIGTIPILLFSLLDSYYLGLERSFRNSYNEFINKLHNGQAQVEDIYIVNPDGGLGKRIQSTLSALFSFSIGPFYILLILMLIIVHEFIL